MKKVVRLGMLVIVVLAFSFVSCDKDDDTVKDVKNKNYGIFTVSDDGLAATVKGGIVDATLQDFRKMLKAYPNLKTLNMVDVPGSNVSGDKNTD